MANDSQLVPVTVAQLEAFQQASMVDLESMVEQAVTEEMTVLRGYVALTLIHDRRLYGRSFERYAYDRFGISRTSANRWLKVGRWVLEEIEAGRQVTKAPSQEALGREPSTATRRGGVTTTEDEPAGQRVPDAVHSESEPATESAKAKPEARPTPTQPKRVIEATARSANEAPTARTLAAELAGQAAMAWDAIPPEHIRALGAHVDAQKSKRGMGVAQDPDEERLIAGVRAFAGRGRMTFRAAVDRVLEKFERVSAPPEPSSNGAKREVTPLFRKAGRL